MNLGLWGLNALTYNGTLILNAKQGIPVSIDTDPPRVRLTVNGKIWVDRHTANGWIQSPATIHVAPGQHNMTIDRPGYAPHSFKVLVNPDSALQLKPSMEILPNAKFEAMIEGTGDGTDEIHVTIDHGLEEGPLPLRVDDLTPGPHVLELKVTGLEGFRVKPHRCNFIVAPGNSDPIHQINVSRTGKKIKASGCKRVKDTP